MGLTVTNALVSVGQNGGSLAPQSANATLNVAANTLLTFALTSFALIQAWDIVITDLDNPQLVYSGVINRGQQNQFQLQLGPASRRLAYVSTVSDGASSTAFVSGSVIATTATSGGGGATTLNADFASPAFGASAIASVVASVGAVVGNGANVGPTNSYIITAVPDSTHVTLLNGNVNNSVGTIASGATVVLSAGVLPTASAAPLVGQAAQVNSAGKLAYVGMQPVVNMASFAVDPTGATISRAGVIAACAAASAAQLKLSVPNGKYTLDDCVVIPGPLLIESPGIVYDPVFGPVPQFYTSAITSGKYWGGAYIGPAFLNAPVTAGATVPYIHSGNFWWADRGGYDSSAASIEYLVWSQSPLANMNGKTAFTLEWMQASSSYTPGTVFPAVQGGRTHSAPLTSCLAVSHFNSVAPGFGVNITLTTVNGVFTAASADQIFAFNTDYGCSLSYDGANFRMWRGPAGGTAAHVASVAATGAVVQNWWEDFIWASSSGPGQWPFGVTDGSGPMRFGNLRLSATARHTGTGSYSLPTTEFVAADCDANTDLLTSFAPTYTTSSSYPRAVVMSACGNPSAHGLGFIATPCNVWMMWRNAIGVEGAPNLFLKNIAIATFGDCLVAECAIGLQTDGCYFQGGKGITALNNGYYGRHVNESFYVAGDNSRAGHSWGLCLGLTCGVAILDNLNWVACSCAVGIVIAGSGATKLSNCKINTVSGQVGLYVSGGDLEMDNLGMGDEGSGGTNDSLMLFDNCQNVSWYGGGAFPIGAGPSAAAVRIDGGTQYVFNVDLAAVVGGVGALVKFVSAPVNPLRLESAYQGQGIEPVAQWANGTGVSIVLTSQELSGTGALTFASDTDFTLSGIAGINGILFGTNTIGGTPLTATRTVTIPRNVNKRTRWNNTLTHDVVIKGPTGTGPTILALSTGYTFDNGTNIVAG